MFKPKTLDRYILREVAGPLGLGLIAVTFALVVARLLKLIDLVVNHGFSLGEIAGLLAYIIPSFLELTFPMAILLGTLLGFGRLSADQEVTAARSCGVSLYRMAMPALFLALGAYLFSSWLAFSVRPWANASMRYELYRVLKERATVGLKEKVFNRFFPGLVVYVEKIRPPGTKLEGILIADERTPGQESTIAAHRGYVIPDEGHEEVTLHLLDGSQFGVDQVKHTTHVTLFQIYDLTFRPGESMSMLKHIPEDMSYAELKQQIASSRAAHHPNHEVEAELARKYTVPVATFLFTLLGISLGLKPARGGQSERFGISVAIFAIYYALMRAGQSVAEAGRMNAFLALSLPDIAFAVVAIYLFQLSATDRINQSRGPGDFFWNLVETFERRRQPA